jgi:hypothetical protein
MGSPRHIANGQGGAEGAVSHGEYFEEAGARFWEAAKALISLFLAMTGSKPDGQTRALPWWASFDMLFA